MRQEIRSSDVFLKLDLVNLLQAMQGTNEGLAAALPDVVQVQAYRAGFNAAVWAMALAIGASEYVQTGTPAQGQRPALTYGGMP